MKSKKKRKQGKKTSQKNKSKKQLKKRKGKKKSDKKKSRKQATKRKGKKKSDKKKSSKQSKKGKGKKKSGKKVDAIQRGATRAVDESTLSTTASAELQATQSAEECNYGSNCAIFEWDGASWIMVEENCNYGCVPLVPEEPGSFPGDRTVTTCRSAVAGVPCPPVE